MADIHRKSAESAGQEQVIPTVFASHCGGTCLLKAHVRDGVMTRIDTDDGDEPQLRACMRGRAYRQRVYAPDRLLFPMKRIGARGEGKFQRITWDEALDSVAREIKRVRDTYGPASIVLSLMAGDLVSLHGRLPIERVFNLAGGHTATWGIPSFQGGVFASLASYGSYYTSNTRDDLLNSRFILLWGWDPATTVGGANTCWYLARAREAGTGIVCVDPRFTDTAAALTDRWIPIRPGTDTAMLLAMAHVIIRRQLHDVKFIKAHVSGFEQFERDVMGIEHGAPRTPEWAELVTGVPSQTIEQLAVDYATLKPAALMAGIAPGRTAIGEQYHRVAIALAAITGNVGIHGGDAAGRAWESLMGGYPYPTTGMGAAVDRGSNPVERPFATGNVPLGHVEPRIHHSKLADAILRGKAGGYHADYKMLYVALCNYLNQMPDINKTVRALKTLEFVAVQEQFLTPTARFADILLPANTFMERNDIARGVGLAYIGAQNKAIGCMGESKSSFEIAALLADRLGIADFEARREDEILKAISASSGAPGHATWKDKGAYRLRLREPHVAFKEQIDYPQNHPFKTPSGKIELCPPALATANDPPVNLYCETPEGRTDPLAIKYPLQLITTHFKRRALSQFENIPWLKELQGQAAAINTEDARARGISDGDTVAVFNDRGRIIIKARVTERIMPGVVDVPHGAWYDPDKGGVDRGGSANVLTSDTISPGGAFTYNTALVEVEKA